MDRSIPHDSRDDGISSDRLAVDRAVDASANRATEALRVAEDLARFALNDASLTGQCKDLRHDLLRLVDQFSPTESRIRARDLAGDVGTEISTPGEYHRTSIPGLAASNLRRAQQAVRSLEEFAKLRDQGAAADLEKLRYQLYLLERPFHTIDQSSARLANCSLCILVDGRADLDDFQKLIEQLVGAGTPMIQLRDKSLSDRELFDRAQRLVQITKSHGALSVINDRADLAAAAGADGVHLGQDDLPLAAARRLLPPNTLIGVSTHTIEQARHAVLAGADYLGMGPVFPSRTKPFAEHPGLALVQSVSIEVGLPAFAIGGITPDNLPMVLENGGMRVAVHEAVLSACSPRSVVHRLLQTLSGSLTARGAAHA